MSAVLSAFPTPQVVLFKLLLVTASLLVICWAQSERPRSYPFCIDDQQLERYKDEFVGGDEKVKLIDKLKLYVHNGHDSPLRKKKVNIGKCVNCGHGVIKAVNYFRISPKFDHLTAENDGQPTLSGPAKVNYLKYSLGRSLYKSMRQWIHIYIEMDRSVQGLVVQSMAGYQGMPHGEFNLEFACTDCNGTDGFTHAERENGLLMDTLNSHGAAALVPCKRRTYIHSRHPNVYVFASNTGRTGFHINFNFLDVACRDMKMFQFLILAIPEIDGQTDKATYFYTAAIDHNYVESLDGAPSPYHVDFRNHYRCHVEDEELVDTPPLNLRMVPGGDKVPILMNLEYDQCLQEPFHSVDKDDPFIEDGTWNGLELFQSRYICKKPVRSLCNFSDPNEISASSAGCETNPTKSCLCEPCSYVENSYTREISPRLIRKAYMATRFHGVLMIISCIAVPVVSIHFARYYKETGGGCVVVGWWFWIHMALTHTSNAAIFVGLLIVLSVPNRNTENEYERRRLRLLNTIHSSFGVIAVVIFQAEFWLGSFRPRTFRYLSILFHSIAGYLVVLFGVLAALISVVCLEMKVYVGGILIIASLPWICACGLQRYLDSDLEIIPPRMYFPVLEAVRVPKEIPCKILRFWMTGTMIFGVVALVALSSLAGGYEGVKMFDQCTNCIWKWEDIIVYNQNDTMVDYTYFKYHYKCNLTKDIWSNAFFLF